MHCFRHLHDALFEIDKWRKHYTEVRPHRSLGKIPPRLFAEFRQHYRAVMNILELWFSNYKNNRHVKIIGWEDEISTQKEVEKWRSSQ